MLYDCPLLLPNVSNLLILPSYPERLPLKQVTLAVWPLSGDVSQSLVFLQGSPKLSCHPGDQYGSAWAKWSSWCVQWQEDPISCNLSRFLEFLAELFDAGLQYRTINVYRSAISVSCLAVDGCLLGSHPLATRFMKGVHELRLPQPRVFNTWSANTILLFLRSLHPAEDLPLKTLTFKFVMLSALVSAARCSYLHQFDLKFHYVKDNCYYFIIPGLVKGSRPNKPHLEVCLHSFPEDPRLCIFTYSKEYIKRT